jgi:UDP-3-O-[3-hydroxymyristoyl] glucosamine N-acyltransferase
MSDKYADAIRQTRAGAVFITEKLKNLLPQTARMIVVEDPELAMAYASRLFQKRFNLPSSAENRIDLDAIIFPGAQLGSGVAVGRNSRIMPGVYLGDGVTVGENTLIHPNCVIYHGCHIGSNCIIHANTVIGSDGFGYAHTKQGEHVKIEQMGNVVIEDDVEIGSNTSIDRAAFTSTLIKKGSKIDNLVHISHNVVVGERTIIAGQTGIAGSTIIGKNVVMAAQSGAVGHITIADFTTVAARGGVTKNTEAGKTYAGFPMMEHKMWLKLQATLARLLK